MSISPARQAFLAISLAVSAVACGSPATSSTTGGADATTGPSNTCASASGSVGADTKGVLTAAIGSQQLKDGTTLSVGSGATSSTEIQLVNSASGFSALEVAVSGVSLAYTAPAKGVDGNVPAFECQAQDLDGSWVACDKLAFPTLVPTDPGYDLKCASARHANAQVIRVLYHKPADGGARTATLTIAHIDTVTPAGESPKVTTLAVKFNSVVGLPQIVVDPTIVQFGNAIAIGDEATQTVTIQNKGQGDLLVATLTVAKDAPQFFYAHDQTTDQTFAGNTTAYTLDPPWTIAPGTSRTLDVGFHGLDGSPHASMLTLGTNDPKSVNTNVELRANQNIACIKIVPDKLLSWGGVLVGTQSMKYVQVKNCGTEPLELDKFAVGDDKDAAFAFDKVGLTIGQTPATAPLTLTTNQIATIPIDCVPPSVGTFTANLTFHDNTLTPQKVVGLTCNGVTTQCATPLIACLEGEEVPPQSEIHLTGENSLNASGGALTYKWSIVKQPKGTEAYTFAPSDKAAAVTFGTDTANGLGGVKHQLNVVGTYVFRLEVKDDKGKDGCGPVDYTVSVKPDQGLHVELLWDTPGDTDKNDDTGADLDLHFAHPDAEKANICQTPLKLCNGTPCACQYDLDNDGTPDPWFNAQFDAYWYNTSPAWGNQQIADDDPVLTLDDTNGWGPENLNMAAPENLLYRVGVHYWDAHDMGNSTATINFYIDGLLITTVTQLLKECDMWWVKRVDYAQKTLADFPNAGVNGKVTPNYSSLLAKKLGGPCQ